jgi:hypothetical protein
MSVPASVLKKLLLAAGAVFLLSLTFLTDPLDRVYNEQTLDQDLADILAYQAPDSSAYRAIKQYMLVMAFSDEPLTGKTYRQMVALYALWEEQQQQREAIIKAREEQATQEEERRYAQLREIVALTLTGREVTKQDTTQRLTFFYTLKNESRKPIRAVQGYLEINYGMHGYALGIDLNFESPLKARASCREQFTFSKVSSASVPGDKEVATTVWRPSRIVFTDGETRE